MSYEVMSSAIENFYAATEGAASRVIAFHGGEPLLHYGEILRVVDKFKCNIIINFNVTYFFEYSCY